MPSFDPDALEAHHTVEEWFQKRLNISGALTGEDTPAFVMSFKQHRAAGQTPESIVSLLRQRIGNSSDPDLIMQAIKDVYVNMHGESDLWTVTRNYLRWKGFSPP